jgi:hypothetical protein
VTPEQRRDALAVANEHQAKRRELLKQIKARETRVPDVLTEHPVPKWLESLGVERLLDTIPRLPKSTLHSMLYEVPILLTATVGDLTYRKRRVLADRVAEFEARREQVAERKAKRAVPRAYHSGKKRRIVGAA